MNTPAHAILNLALLDRDAARPRTGPVIAGALAPDAPILGFYAWQKLAVGSPEPAIWGQLYFRPEWQLFFDVFNSIPLALTGWLVARWRGLEWLGAFSLSVALHALMDLPVHHDDGHRHFLPLSHWRFESPLSYWDPRHHGAMGAALEATLVLAATALLWQRYPGPTARALLLGVNALYATVWVAFHL